MIDRKIKVAYIFTSCKQSGPIQQMYNLIKNLNLSMFEPILITLYDEEQDGTSQLSKYLELRIKHYKCPLSKMNMMLGRTNSLKELLLELDVDVIHSLGVFPDYVISKMKTGKQIITLRNYIWEDYPSKFGKIMGSALAFMHLYAMKHTAKTVTCSNSLAKIYHEKLNLDFEFVCNGVDIENFKKVSREEVTEIRKKLHLPLDSFVFVYSGQMIERKNQKFLLDVFASTFGDSKAYLLLLGDGSDYSELKDKYGNLTNVDFRGNVSNIAEFLTACDAYVSTSKSEGMPNGVLEAMASGIPVVLSDIPQHLEVYNVDHKMGYIYKQSDKEDLSEKMLLIYKNNDDKMVSAAFNTAHEHFSAPIMSENYQKIYTKISKINNV